MHIMGYVGSFFFGMALASMFLFLIFLFSREDETHRDQQFKIAVLAALMAIICYLRALIG